MLRRAVCLAAFCEIGSINQSIIGSVLSGEERGINHYLRHDESRIKSDCNFFQLGNMKTTLVDSCMLRTLYFIMSMYDEDVYGTI